MRVALLTSVRDSWSSVPLWLTELRPVLSQVAHLEASLWLIDDAADARPPSWHTLDTAGTEIHVLQLQGRQGRHRSYAAALGYLLCEREERFDAYLIVDNRHPSALRNLAPLIDTATRNPEAVVLAPARARGGIFSSVRYAGHRGILRALCGQSIAQSPLLFLPAEAVEALCHSGQAGNHLESAVAHLGLPVVVAPMPRSSCALDVIAAASVFRERVLARIYAAALGGAITAALAAVTGAALRIGGVVPIPTALIAGLALLTPFFGALALCALLLGVFVHALNESRRWTPALDGALLVREVTRVKRQPYGLADRLLIRGKTIDA